MVDTQVSLEIVAWLIRLTILLGVFWGVDFAIRRSHPRWRVLLWRSSLVAIIALPVAALLIPQYAFKALPPVQDPDPVHITQQAESDIRTATSADAAASESPASSTASVNAAESEGSHAFPWLWTLVGVYTAGLLIMLLRLYVTSNRVRHLTDTEIADDDWLNTFARTVARDLNYSSRFHVYLCPKLSTPFVTGLLKPRLFLPSDSLDKAGERELRGVLAHELSHLKNHDLYWGIGLYVLKAVLWFHPLIWKIHEAHSTACEQVCDLTAAEMMGDRRDYQRLLARLTIELNAPPPAVTGIPMARLSDVTKRVRILDGRFLAKPPRGRLLLGFALAGLAGSICLSAFGLGYADEKEEEEIEVVDVKETKSGESAKEVEEEHVESISLGFSVPSHITDGWMETRVYIRKGDDVSIEAKGEVVWDPTLPLVNPDGDGRIARGNVGRPDQFLAPDTYCGALVARIGEDGDPFMIGKNRNWIADDEGVLYLGVNDRRGHFDDNSGEFLVTLLVNTSDKKMSPGMAAIPRSSGVVVEEEAIDVNPLQAQINQAQPGDVVIIPAGIHNQQPLVIDKPLTLTGSHTGESVLEYMDPYDGRPAITIINTEDVTLDNFRVRWSIPAGTRPEKPGAVHVSDSTVTLHEMHINPLDLEREIPYALYVTGASDVDFIDGSTTGFSFAIMFTESTKGSVRDSILQDAAHSVVTLHSMSEVEIANNILLNCDYHAVRNTGGYMDMHDNVVYGCLKAGAYLGNKPAHGRIHNNLFYANRGGIWSYSGSDVVLTNNVFYENEDDGLAVQGECSLEVAHNSIIGHPSGVSIYKPIVARKGATLQGNHYFRNDQDTKDIEQESDALEGDPLFLDPKNGDFSVREGSPLLKNDEVLAGLENPEAIHTLWRRWKEEE